MSAAAPLSASRPAARLFGVAALALLLGACASAPGKRSPPSGQVVPAADAAAREAARIARLRGQDAWALSGRIAVSNAGKGGSGRIEWNQRGDAFDVALSAPVTRQSWRLSGGPDGARLEGLDGGPREGGDAAALLREATGWEIPVAALADWLRALPAAGGAQAQIAPEADGRPQSIEQGGWRIGYEWPATGDLPARLDARRDGARVRLIVDQWQGLADADSGLPEPAAESQAEQLQRELSQLDLNDPAADLRRNVARGDRRPIGVCGFACLAPGLPQSEQPPRQGLRILSGTGDVVEGERHERLIEQARAYATAYNRALGDWLRAHPSRSPRP